MKLLLSCPPLVQQQSGNDNSSINFPYFLPSPIRQLLDVCQAYRFGEMSFLILTLSYKPGRCSQNYSPQLISINTNLLQNWWLHLTRLFYLKAPGDAESKSLLMSQFSRTILLVGGRRTTRTNRLKWSTLGSLKYRQEICEKLSWRN